MKKPTLPSFSSRRQGFTLVELLIVITIIGVLAGIAMPVFSQVTKNAKKTQTRMLCNGLVVSIKSYYTEYSRYPSPPGGAASEAAPLRSDESIVSALMPGNKERNPRNIKFLPDMKDVSDAEVPSNGLVNKGGGAMYVVDSFGEEFYILMDSDYNNEIENPNPNSSAMKLFEGVLVYSSGPDKNIETWEDNVTSWTSGSDKK